MTWTTRTPTQPGWDWARTKPDDMPIVAYIDEHMRVLFPGHDYMMDFSDVADGQWSSEPITEPEDV